MQLHACTVPVLTTSFFDKMEYSRCRMKFIQINRKARHSFHQGCDLTQRHTRPTSQT